MGLMLGMAMVLSSCYHGRVRLSPPLPEACRNGLENTAACRVASRDQAALLENSTKETTTVTNDFFLFGFFPEKVEIDAGSMCPNGVYEVHQYHTWMDMLLAHLTAGIYMPRTTRITCY